MSGTGGRRIWWAMALVVVILVVVAGVVLVMPGTSDRIQVLMPNSTGVVTGDDVLMNGQVVGSIDGSPELVGQPGDTDRALVTVAMQSDAEPLRQGANARVAWEATVGQRSLTLIQGPPGAPVLPDGARIVSTHEAVELGSVLTALDPPTRQHLNGLVQQVQQTLGGREPDLNATLRTGGPAVDALGEVLKAVGSDGPALRQLITQVRQVTDVLTRRRAELGGTIQNLGPVTNAVASEQQALSSSLGQLPSTLSQAQDTLDRVPGAVDKTIPLLKDLQPGTAKLPSVAAKLNPVLRDLRPTVADLKPTLGAANQLLDYTPPLLDSAHAVVPPLTYTVSALRPALSFLRPYGPETLASFLSNWNSLFASKTPEGNYGRAKIVESDSSVNNLPGPNPPPGLQQDFQPLPGSIGGQPWTDANGDGLR